MLYPQKNFIPKQNLINGSWQVTNSIVSFVSNSPLYYALPTPVRLPAGTYTISALDVINAAIITSGGVLFGTNDNLPKTFTLSKETDAYIHFRKRDNTNWDLVTDIEVLKIQLEKGSFATPYETYRLINKPAAMNKESLFPDMSGAASHAFVALNVFTAKKKVKLGKTKISVASTGSFNISVQEWQDGIGLVGSPIYQKDQTINATGLMDYDFGGVVLEKGKSYVIGRYNQTGAAGVLRTTNMPVPNSKYVTWIGGTTPSQSSIIYPTTYYYFYGIEFEAFDENKPAQLVPKNNLSTGVYSVMHISGVDDLATLQTGTAGTVSMSVPVTPNKRYKVTKRGRSNRFMLGSFTSLTGNLRVVKQINNHSLTESGSSLELDVGDANFLVVYLSSADEKPAIEIEESPYPKVNKPTNLYTKNAMEKIDSLSQLATTRVNVTKDGEWFKGVTTTNASTDNYAAIKGPRVVNTYDLYPVKPSTDYVFSALLKSDGTNSMRLRVIEMSAAGGVLVDNLNTSYIDTIETRKGLAFKTTANTAYVLLRVQFHSTAAMVGYFKDLQLEEGTVMTPFEPYKLKNKPAVLYPEKNLMPPIGSNFTGIETTNPDGGYYTSGLVAGDKVTVKGAYELEIIATGNNRNVFVMLPAQPLKNYRASATTNGDIHIAFFSANRVKITTTYDLLSTNKVATAPADAIYMQVIITNRGLGAGTFNFKNWQVEEVATASSPATPFEPYKLGNKK